MICKYFEYITLIIMNYINLIIFKFKNKLLIYLIYITTILILTMLIKIYYIVSKY